MLAYVVRVEDGNRGLSRQGAPTDTAGGARSCFTRCPTHPRPSPGPKEQSDLVGSCREGKERPFLLLAGIAQLVERQLPKLNVEGSNPFARFGWSASATRVNDSNPCKLVRNCYPEAKEQEFLARTDFSD